VTAKRRTQPGRGSYHQRASSSPTIARRRFLQSMGVAATGLLTGCSASRRLISGPASAPTASHPSIDTALPSPITTPEPALAPGAAASGPNYWPTHGWRTSTPEQQGVDSEQLARMIQYIQDQGLNLHSLLIVRNGYVVTDAYIHPFTREAKHIIHSCAKSIISALVGIAIDKGYIQSVGQPVLELFPERSIARIDSNKRALTLEDVLTMATGLECRDTGSYQYRGFSQMTQSQDWAQFVLDLPMAEEPGTRFEYCNAAALLLSAIIHETTGMSALTFAEEHLFGPLGIADVEWLSSPQGVSLGYGRLWMRPSDMAKIGYLYLNKGVWDGQQIVSSAWVETSTRRHISTSGEDGYGYQWWVKDSGIYEADGYAGQRIIVLPDQEMVLVFTAGLREQELFDLDILVDYFILPAAGSSIPQPENSEGLALLESQIQALADPEPEPVPSLPTTAQSVSGRRYVLEDDILGWGAFSLEFKEQEALISLFFGEDSLELPIGLDGVYRITYVDQPAFATLLTCATQAPDLETIAQVNQPGFITGSVALKGFWQTDNTFVIYEELVGMHDKSELRLTFDENGANVWERALVRAMPPDSQRTRGTLQD